MLLEYELRARGIKFWRKGRYSTFPCVFKRVGDPEFSV